MPRDSQGLYTLPAGNPVTAGTLIEAQWANSTMPDLGQALTDSLPRNGNAPMVGNLTLANSTPTNNLHAASKGYIDAFLAYASGLPISACIPIAAAVVPPGWLLCNGQAVSRTTYSDLFAAIGTTYNAGNTDPLTFKVPDLQNRVVKGKGGSRALGSTEAAAVGGHTHGVSDAGHSHGVTDAGHEHALSGLTHKHTITEPNSGQGHRHGSTGTPTTKADGTNVANTFQIGTTGFTGYATTGITINDQTSFPSAKATNGTTGVTVNTGTTGIGINDNAAGVENVVANMALDYYIKATQDSSSPAYINSLASNDVAAISIDLTTDPTEPMLLIHSNVANGLVKLDAGNKIPSNLIPFSGMNYQGPWDASTGNTPSQSYPSTTFYDGDIFQIAVAGTLTVYDYTGTLAPRSCPIGSSIVYATDGTVFPVPGWYLNPAPTLAGATAAQIAFQPVGGISATDVQAACAELDTEKASYPATTAVLKGNGGTGFADAVAGTDYLAPAAIGTTVQGYDAATAKTDVSQDFTAPQRAAPLTDDDGTFDLSVANNFNCAPVGAVALTFINPVAGQTGIIRFTNGAAFAVTKAASTKSNSTFLTTVSATGTYLIGYYCDGTDTFLCTDGAQS
jgi:microcystin-dependent protein